MKTILLALSVMQQNFIKINEKLLAPENLKLLAPENLKLLAPEFAVFRKISLSPEAIHKSNFKPKNVSLTLLYG